MAHLNIFVWFLKLAWPRDEEPNPNPLAPQANDANAAKDQAARDAANASRRAEQLTKDLHDKDDAHQLEKATFLKQIDELMRKNKK